MAAPSPTPDAAFLSVIAWPPGMDVERVADLVYAASGIDRFYVRQRLAGGVPAVIQRVDAGASRPMVDELRTHGVFAVAPTQTQMRAFAGPIRAKRLAPALGAPEPMFLCEPWRGEAFGFTARSIAVMVRARLSRSHKSAPRLESSGAGYGAMAGAPVPYYEVVRDSRSSLHDILDIYLRDRRRIRCHGDKFNFDILGSSKGFSDNENMDKLAVMLADAAPRAIVDLGFADFSCPPILAEISRTASNGDRTTDDHPMFDFYSPWIVLIHAAIAAGEKSMG